MEGWHEALVRGGRYDKAASAYGRERPATGFIEFTPLGPRAEHC